MPFKAQKLAAVRRVVSKVAQQLGAVAALLLRLLVLLLGGTVLLARFALNLALCLALGLDGLFAAGLGDGAAARQLVGGHLAVFFGQLAGRLAVQVEPLRALRHRRSGRAWCPCGDGRKPTGPAC
jgi:hypothetical protein